MVPSPHRETAFLSPPPLSARLPLMSAWPSVSSEPRMLLALFPVVIFTGSAVSSPLLPRDNDTDGGVPDAPQSSGWVAAVVVIVVLVIVGVISTICYVHIKQRRRRRDRARAKAARNSKRAGRPRDHRRSDSQASSFSDDNTLVKPLPALTSDKRRRSLSTSNSERNSISPERLSEVPPR